MMCIAPSSCDVGGWERRGACDTGRGIGCRYSYAIAKAQPALGVETEASRIDGYQRLFLIVRHRTLRVAQTPCDKVPSMRRTICADPQRYVDQY